MSNETSMQIKFEGQTHQIDANTLINTLIHYNAILLEVNKQYGGGEKELSLNVNALKEGSFIIDLSLVEASSLFSGGNIGYIASVITIAGAVFKGYKILKGRKAKNKEERDSIKIKMGDVHLNDTIINVYNETVVREAISKSLQTAKEDVNVEGISILGKDNDELVNFNKEEFNDLIYTDFDVEGDQPDEVTEVVDTLLTIIGLSFERGSTWRFMYKGFKISMVVKDDALMEMIDKGERFGKGDSIRVKMRILRRYNNDYHTYENKSFRIIEFIEHIIAPNQSNLPFD
jgi:hypothetical protein